ncbi:hypothetical protein TNCT_281711 [Trichonephila clavata]|uniref:Uncharacterized protein n=1 Tax=Trichonephila clavata TaxID=2740835 RepID=A0A8X6GJY4_TRICU|nr:hypothetical protein TNCT_281711 [Trichonephila clavata]
MLTNTEGRGRKKIMNSITESRVIHQVKIDPKISALKIAASTSNTLGRSVSAETDTNPSCPDLRFGDLDYDHEGVKNFERQDRRSVFGVNSSSD